jgi:hypothetical protein
MKSVTHVPRLPESRSTARFPSLWWSPVTIILFVCHLSRAQTSGFESNVFWGVSMLCTTPALPPATLGITKLGDTVKLSWPVIGSDSFSTSNYVVDTKADVTAPWTFLSPRATPSGDEMAATLPASNDQKFFRLRAPDHCLGPVFQFAVFYDGLLEFSSAPTWTIEGRVHANHDIYTGSASRLTFNKLVTVGGTITSPTNNGSGPNWTYKGTYNGNPTYVTNVPVLKFLPEPSVTNAHVMIEMPPVGIPPVEAIKQGYLFYLAQVVLLISSTTVTANIRSRVDDPSPAIIGPIYMTNNAAMVSNFPFLVTTNVFTDQRESPFGNRKIYSADVDLAKYKLWIATNILVTSKTLAPTILFVANNRTPSSTVLPAVRLKNGKDLPSYAGFTVVTPNPLYVLGHYNCPNNSHLGTTNTTETVPAALMSDALTILSANWNDATSSSAYTVRDAADTTVNAAILTGNIPTTGAGNTRYSGGVHNLPRLLEDWLNVSGGQRTLTLNTSFVCLFQSNQVTRSGFKILFGVSILFWILCEDYVKSWRCDSHC